MNNINNNVCVEEDEIDLKELFGTIWKYKIFIAVFVFIVTSFAIIFALSKPNEYKVYTLLAPQEQSKSMNLGGLGALASMAGVSVGGSSGITPDIAFSNLLSDYPFMKNFILKNGIDKQFLSSDFDEKFVFAMNNRDVYDYFHSKNDEKKEINFFSNIYQPISKMISISSDKKTGLISASVEGANREFNYYLLNKFLEEATIYLVNRNLKDITSKIDRYQKELQTTNNLELKAELAKLISNLIKQKVYINSSKYYKVRVITDPYIPDVKDKTKPKRALIVIVAFVTSFILGIFLVFFIEFVRGDEDEK